ncbi:MAG: hypothetical protein PW788_05070 [Micavibrio sp.]|nr:hypothetical protein [Micavibrio sp.]
MTGISAGKAVCNAVIDNTNIIPTSCSPLFAIGIDATKHLICGP